MTQHIDRETLERAITAGYAEAAPRESFVDDLEIRLSEQSSGTLERERRPWWGRVRAWVGVTGRYGGRPRRGLARPRFPGLPPVWRPLTESLVIVVPIAVLAVALWRIGSDRQLASVDEWPAVGTTEPAPTPDAAQVAMGEALGYGWRELTAPVTKVVTGPRDSLPVTLTVRSVLVTDETTIVDIEANGPGLEIVGHVVGYPGATGAATLPTAVDAAVPPAFIDLGDRGRLPLTEGGFSSTEQEPGAFARTYSGDPIPPDVDRVALEITAVPHFDQTEGASLTVLPDGAWRLDLALRPVAEGIAEEAAVPSTRVTGASAAAGRRHHRDGRHVHGGRDSRQDRRRAERVATGRSRETRGVGRRLCAPLLLPTAVNLFAADGRLVAPLPYGMAGSDDVRPVSVQIARQPVTVSSVLGQAARPGDPVAAQDAAWVGPGSPWIGHDPDTNQTGWRLAVVSRAIDEVAGADPGSDGTTMVLTFAPVPADSDLSLEIGEVTAYYVAAAEGSITIDFDGWANTDCAAAPDDDHYVVTERVDATLDFGPAPIDVVAVSAERGATAPILTQVLSSCVPVDATVPTGYSGLRPDARGRWLVDEVMLLPAEASLIDGAFRSWGDLTGEHRFVPSATVRYVGPWLLRWNGQTGLGQPMSREVLAASVDGTVLERDDASRTFVVEIASGRVGFEGVNPLEGTIGVALDPYARLVGPRGGVETDLGRIEVGDKVSINGYQIPGAMGEVVALDLVDESHVARTEAATATAYWADQGTTPTPDATGTARHASGVATMDAMYGTRPAPLTPGTPEP